MSGGARLVLGMLRAPAGVTAVSREVASHRFGIGRGADNDWTLPDTNKAVSKRHCVLEPHDGGWFVTDLSSNGTSINGRLLEPRAPRALQDGDLIGVGPYEFETRLGRSSSWLTDHGDAREPRRGQDLFDDRLTGDPFPITDGDALEVAKPSVGLPEDFDPLGGESNPPSYIETAADHVPDLNQNFRPPRPSFEVLPEDWDAGIEPSAPAQQPRPTEQLHPPEQSRPPEQPPPPAQPHRTEDSHPVEVPRPAMPQADLPVTNPVPTDARGNAASGFAAFAIGAGLSGKSVDDADAVLHAVGAAFREIVSGLRRTLIARATIKGELRIDQTMIRAKGNNPLKFSADDDDALSALLGLGRKTGMTPQQAIAESLRDMRLHELAVASAMQRAVRDVLAAFDPAMIVKETKGGMLGDVFNQRKRQAWDAHCERYAKIVAALSDNFDSIFGKSFVRAYEAALTEFASQDRDIEDGENLP